MNKETKDRLKLIPNPRCSVCDSSRQYSNPLDKCFGCDKWFCFDHIWSKTSEPQKSINGELALLCDVCKFKTPIGNLATLPL